MQWIGTRAGPSTKSTAAACSIKAGAHALGPSPSTGCRQLGDPHHALQGGIYGCLMATAGVLCVQAAQHGTACRTRGMRHIQLPGTVSTAPPSSSCLEAQAACAISQHRCCKYIALTAAATWQPGKRLYAHGWRSSDALIVSQPYSL
jgi:hypothetical protein